jgi:putative hydrolase of the HAD superfamily
MTLTTILLDFGGTLAHEHPPRAAIYAAAASARGREVDAAAMRLLMRDAHAGLPRTIDGAWRYSDRWFEAFIARIFGARLGLGAEALPGLRAELFERFADPRTYVLRPGALALLADLRAAGLRIGLVSNWSERLPALLRGLGLAERVDFAVCSALERTEKPDARIFARALDLAGARPDQALHAGDDLEKDVLGARRAGLRAVLVDHDASLAGLGVPRVRDLAGLRALLLRLAA